MTTNSEISICYECIGDVYLSNEISNTGTFTECDYCNTPGSTIKLSELGERIHEILENYYSQTSSEPEGYDYALAKEGIWERDGEIIEYLICDIAGIESEAGKDVLAYLSDVYDARGKDSLYEEQPYDIEAQYEEKEIDTAVFSEDWLSFKRTIRTQSRFFNKLAEETLDKLFFEVDKLVTNNDESVLFEMPCNDPNVVIYRGRVALSPIQIEKILIELPRSMGAPTHDLAKSGRMNATGISVFYGALDAATCIAEIRAPVGSSVIVGKFHPLRNLSILDLNRLQKIFVTGSRFDPNHIVELSRARFLESLVDEISAPVMPGSEEQEYLPTQFVAEYLSQLEYLELDGVIFNSQQVSNSGRNLVLFDHASTVESYHLPENTELEVNFRNREPDYYDPDITIWEVTPASTEEKADEDASRYGSRALFAGTKEYGRDDESFYKPTLRLELESLRVHEVSSVEYECLAIDVTRRKYDKQSEIF